LQSRKIDFASSLFSIIVAQLHGVKLTNLPSLRCRWGRTLSCSAASFQNMLVSILQRLRHVIEDVSKILQPL
ncbi:hypothetical protein CUMW_170090, partial [Citrus unshiu]